MDGVSDVVIEGAVLVTGVRVIVRSRVAALARPRRGSADLGDRDAPPREHEDADVRVPTPSTARAPRWATARAPWVAGAVYTIGLAITVGFAVRGAVALV